MWHNIKAHLYFNGMTNDQTIVLLVIFSVEIFWWNKEQHVFIVGYCNQSQLNLSIKSIRYIRLPKSKNIHEYFYSNFPKTWKCPNWESIIIAI